MKGRKLTKNQRMQIWQKYGGRCAYCGEPIEVKQMQVDHIKPKFHNWSEKDKFALLPKDYCGDDSMENLNPSCRMCNFRKGTDTIEMFRNAIRHSLVCLERSFTPDWKPKRQQSLKHWSCYKKERKNNYDTRRMD